MRLPALTRDLDIDYTAIAAHVDPRRRMIQLAEGGVLS